MSLLTTALAGVSLDAVICRAQSAINLEPNHMYVDARSYDALPQPSSFVGGTSVNPAGEKLGINARFLTRDGKPWLPVMGEFHYTRVPEAQWEEEILKMKSAGVSIIATYVIWIHHEEVEGKFDWTGVRDLHRFVELCGKHGMYVYPRIGPWAHGEARNGGYPDWLLQKTRDTRSNDPVYLGYVKQYYAQVAEQLKGELWKDGGPVIGVQLENEYARRGPGAGEEHIRKLKQIAVADGLDVPLYTVTGWDGAVVPQGDVVAVFGGYPDAPWDAALTDLPPEEVYTFRFGSRVTGNMGAIGLAKSAAKPALTYDYPFMTAEMGGGIEDTYHRRPVVQPDDVAAMVPVMLGSGVNLYGSYMFQGGENPDGKMTTLQESQVTKYPTDVPVKSYDFQAPLGEFGQERPVLRKLKVFDYFMQDFGNRLAPMQPHAPSIIPTGPADLSVPRVAVRSNGSEGFLFLNNYVRGAAMPTREHFQVDVRLAGGTVTVPTKPIDLPSGAYGIWPVGLQLEGATLRYATAQLFTEVTNGSTHTYYFAETPGIVPEFAWDGAGKARLKSEHGRVVVESGVTYVRGLQPSLNTAFGFQNGRGGQTNIVLLSQAQAEDAWKVNGTVGNQLVVTEAQFYGDGRHATLESEGSPAFSFSVVPPLGASPTASVPLTQVTGAAANHYAARLEEKHPTFNYEQVAKAGDAPMTRLGPALSWRPVGVAMAPQEDAFVQAARWKLELTREAWNGVEDLFLNVDYEGDVARLTSGGKLLVDDFYNGETWEVGLKRFRKQIEENGLELEILPRRKDAPIFLERSFRQPGTTGQVLSLRSLKIVPQYRLTVDFGAGLPGR